MLPSIQVEKPELKTSSINQAPLESSTVLAGVAFQGWLSHRTRTHTPSNVTLRKQSRILLTCESTEQGKEVQGILTKHNFPQLEYPT